MLARSTTLPINSPEYLELASSPDKRKALAKVTMRVLDLWDIDTATQLTLLGLSEKSRALLTKYKNGTSPLAANQDTLQRSAYILSIYQLLKSLYPRNEETRHHWIKLKNLKLNNYTPLEYMVNGIPELKKINALLQFQMVR